MGASSWLWEYDQLKRTLAPMGRSYLIHNGIDACLHLP